MMPKHNLHQEKEHVIYFTDIASSDICRIWTLMRALSCVKQKRREHTKFKSFPEGMMLGIIWSFTVWLFVQYIDAVQCSAQSQVSVPDCSVQPSTASTSFQEPVFRFYFQISGEKSMCKLYET